VSNRTGLSPSKASRSRELGRHRAKSILYKLQLGPRGPDFKFELLPLHSPLLGQSLLVSFPPLIDMLKFSGYSYLIRGQPVKRGGFTGKGRSNYRGERKILRLECETTPPLILGSDRMHGRLPTLSNEGLRVEMTLEQACPLEY
jgi:hypothetical protein